MVGVEGLGDGSILDVVMLLGFSRLDPESLLEISGNPLQGEEKESERFEDVDKELQGGTHGFSNDILVEPEGERRGDAVSSRFREESGEGRKLAGRRIPSRLGRGSEVRWPGRLQRRR